MNLKNLYKLFFFYLYFEVFNKKLKIDIAMGGLFSFSSLPNVFFDLDNVSPSDEQENQIYESFCSIVKEPHVQILEKFRNYKDGQAFASIALSSPSQENKNVAWEAILPNITLQMETFQFGKKISEYFVSLIKIVMDLATDKAIDLFSNKPVIIKCFAYCFDIILRFDETSLTLPKLVNDLAFFRRNAPSRNQNGEFDDIIEISNLSTVFWAIPMPFLSNVISLLQSTFKNNIELFEKLIILLGTVIDICVSIGLKSSELNEKSMLLLLRCIVGAILMFDHLYPQGAYNNNNKYHIKEALELLINFQPKQIGLINAIKYSSKHLNDQNVDPKIKNYLDNKH